MTWQPKASQNARAIRLFIESMDNINEALCFPPNPVVGHTGKVARRVSIELRKLLFDGRPLLHTVLQGLRLHPLKGRETLTGDIYKNGRQLAIGPATSEGALLGPVATRRWNITVHPLHGLKFDSTEKKWIFHPMFDTNAAPITRDRWLHQRLFCVDGRGYTLLNTLSFLANKEAAHIDTDNTILLKDMERVHFDNTTYYHIVALLTAAYLSDQYQSSKQANEIEWQPFLDNRSYPVTEPGTFIGGEFQGTEIDPMGLPKVFHETGIPIPIPGAVWTPVQVEESTVVHP